MVRFESRDKQIKNIYLVPIFYVCHANGFTWLSVG